MNYKHDGKAEKGNHLIEKETQKAANLLVPPFSTNHIAPKIEPGISKENSTPPIEKEGASKKEQKSEHKTPESFMNSIQDGGETIEALVDSFAKLIEMNAEFNKQLTSILTGSKLDWAGKMLNLTATHIEASKQLAGIGTTDLTSWYVKHTDQAIAFNKILLDSLRTQSETMLKLQSKGMEQFTEWAFDWWKPSEK